MSLKETINQAVLILKQGGIVVFPTDTAFGIGCKIDDVKAVEKLFRIRNRPLSQPVPILVSSKKMALNYYDSPISNNVRQLMDRYWPGALTIVYKCDKDKVPSQVRSNKATIGIRMPNHPVTLEIVRGIKIPLLGPSANFHGMSTPYTFQDLDKNLLKLADYVMPGKCTDGNVSTVVDCATYPHQIIRQGAVIIKSKTRSAILSIDSTDNQKTVVVLEINGKKDKIIEKTRVWASQVLLPMIEQLLIKNNLSAKDLTEIKVKNGPGSFTGIRVGYSIANALGKLLDITVKTYI